MQIGKFKLANRVAMAPMAGVSNLPFRVLAREQGCGLTTTEMISYKALVQGNERTQSMLRFSKLEHPISVQLFGDDPEGMAEAARIVEAAGAEIIDVNMGCPAPKIVRSNGGCSLMKEPEKAAKIVDAMSSAVKVPITVKTRTGWDDNSRNAPELVHRLQEAGAQAIAVHGRTRVQGYSGKADWEFLREIKKRLRIPMWANGDVTTPEEAAKILEVTGCEGVMIGRGALGNPWIFRRILHYFETGEVLPEPGWAERRTILLRHFDMLVEEKGETIAVREMRKHAAWYTRGLKGAAHLRNRVNQTQTRQELLRLLEEWTETDPDREMSAVI